MSGLDSLVRFIIRCRETFWRVTVSSIRWLLDSLRQWFWPRRINGQAQQRAARRPPLIVDLPILRMPLPRVSRGLAGEDFETAFARLYEVLVIRLRNIIRLQGYYGAILADLDRNSDANEQLSAEDISGISYTITLITFVDRHRTLLIHDMQHLFSLRLRRELQLQGRPYLMEVEQERYQGSMPLRLPG